MTLVYIMWFIVFVGIILFTGVVWKPSASDNHFERNKWKYLGVYLLIVFISIGSLVYRILSLFPEVN